MSKSSIILSALTSVPDTTLDEPSCVKSVLNAISIMGCATPAPSRRW